jgi:hypothetical protein
MMLLAMALLIPRGCEQLQLPAQRVSLIVNIFCLEKSHNSVKLFRMLWLIA